MKCDSSNLGEPNPLTVTRMKRNIHTEMLRASDNPTERNLLFFETWWYDAQAGLSLSAPDARRVAVSHAIGTPDGRTALTGIREQDCHLSELNFSLIVHSWTILHDPIHHPHQLSLILCRAHVNRKRSVHCRLPVTWRTRAGPSSGGCRWLGDHFHGMAPRSDQARKSSWNERNELSRGT